ncbi:hypothetical protein WMY93_032461 [Mugilogobius chulae]|uniref:NACHT LRR and PYD domain-containing protein n=1 Tax=Mugilogobius chulae TaxID=88201 RepID=A0AAW0MJH2_9GOBI
MSLAKLAFEQLEKDNYTFSETQISECGINIKTVTAFSGVLTEMLKEDVSRDKVYRFIHLSVQEFLAALHVHSTFVDTEVNVLKDSTFDRVIGYIFKPSLIKLHQAAVEKALSSRNGRWDLVLRFLMGLSQPSNQKLLHGLFKETQFNSAKTAKYIQRKLDQNLPVEQSLNLIYCLAELNDRTLERRIQDAVQSGSLSKQNLTPGEWSALTFVLLSKPDRKDFDLKKYSATEQALRRLMPVVKASNKAMLNLCNLTERVCAELGSLLSSDSCQLTELDLSDNDLKDSGIKKLLAALTTPNYNLQVLRLCGCQITENGCAALAAALQSKQLNVRELDLRYNHPGDSGVNLLFDLQTNADCSLEEFRFDESEEKWLRPGLKKYFCQLNWSAEPLPNGLKMSEDWKELKNECDSKPEFQCTNELSDRCYWEVECHAAWCLFFRLNSWRLYFQTKLLASVLQTKLLASVLQTKLLASVLQTKLLALNSWRLFFGLNSWRLYFRLNSWRLYFRLNPWRLYFRLNSWRLYFRLNSWRLYFQAKLLAFVFSD